MWGSNYCVCPEVIALLEDFGIFEFKNIGYPFVIDEHIIQRQMPVNDMITVQIIENYR